MAGIDWKFVFKRRKWKLENYLSDCGTVGDAQNKFTRAGMSSPPLETLLSHGLKLPEGNKESVTPPASLPSPTVEETSDEGHSKGSSDEQDREYDDIVIIDTPE